jgi:hypothetical protein
MNRSLTALFSALEALLVVGIGIGIPLVPLTALWAFQYGLQIDWMIFWRAAVDIWLLGSGVDVTMTLNPVLASELGFADAGKPFVLTIALLGFALLTVLLGVRAGRRISDIPFRWTAVAIALITFAALPRCHDQRFVAVSACIDLAGNVAPYDRFRFRPAYRARDRSPVRRGYGTSQTLVA